MTEDKVDPRIVLKTLLLVTMEDGSRWAVPTEVIARNRAEHYKDEFDGDVERSLTEDTRPLFTETPYEIEDWATSDMNWSDVVEYAWQVQQPTTMDEEMFQEGWCNGEKEVVGHAELDPESEPSNVALLMRGDQRPSSKG